MQTLTKKRLLAITRQYTGPKISNIVETFGMFLITTEIDLDLILRLFFLFQNKYRCYFVKLIHPISGIYFWIGLFFKFLAHCALNKRQKRWNFVKAVHSTVDHFKQLSFPELSDGEKKNLKNISKTLLLRKGKDYIVLKYFLPLEY